jgi:hypothetical protein
MPVVTQMSPPGSSHDAATSLSLTMQLQPAQARAAAAQQCQVTTSTAASRHRKQLLLCSFALVPHIAAAAVAQCHTLYDS